MASNLANPTNKITTQESVTGMDYVEDSPQSSEIQDDFSQNMTDE